jgi:hypothetical protein
MNTNDFLPSICGHNHHDRVERINVARSKETRKCIGLDPVGHNDLVPDTVVLEFNSIP